MITRRVRAVTRVLSACLALACAGPVLAAAAAPAAPQPSGKAARASARAPAAALGSAEIAARMAALHQQFLALRAQVLAVASDSALPTSERLKRLRQADARLNGLNLRIEDLDARVTALPAGGRSIPNLAGLNPDSLADALARQFGPLMRVFRDRMGDAASQVMLRPSLPWVDWKEHLSVTRLPTVATRSFVRAVGPTPGVRRVHLAHRFGDVRVLPSSDDTIRFSVQVTVQGGMPEAEARGLADQVRLDVALDTACAALAAIPELRGQADRAIRVDLTLQVPAELGASVRNAYGDVIVANVAGPVDGNVVYGDLLAHDLGSAAHFEVRNGDLKVERAAGALELLDQSGMMVLRSCIGPLAADGLGSEMNLDDLRAGGSISARGGSLRLRNVIGPLTLTAQNTSMGVESVRGAVTLNGQASRVGLTQVAGTLNAECLDGSLTTSFVEQDQDIRTRFCDVRVENPGGEVRASGESAPLLLRLTELGAGRHYEATNRYGTVALEIPGTSSAAILAATNFGTIYSDVPVRRRDTGDWQRAEATLGRGEAQVSLQAINSSIRITTTGR